MKNHSVVKCLVIMATLKDVAQLLNVRKEKSEAGPQRKVYVLTGEGDRVLRELSNILSSYFEKLEVLRE